MFNAAMKLKVIDSSIDQLEKTMFAPEAKEPLKAIQCYVKECEGNTKVAEEVALSLANVHGA